MSHIAKRIVEGLQDFNRKLKLGLPIYATRVKRCECRGQGCPKCKGRGATFSRVRLQ